MGKRESDPATLRRVVADRGSLAETRRIPGNFVVSPNDAYAAEEQTLPAAIAVIANLFNVINFFSAESPVREQVRMEAAIFGRVNRSGGVDVYGNNSVAG